MAREMTIVTWPDSQILMEQDWFDQCILVNDEKGIEIFGSSAYEVPTKLYNTLKK